MMTTFAFAGNFAMLMTFITWLCKAQGGRPTIALLYLRASDASTDHREVYTIEHDHNGARFSCRDNDDARLPRCALPMSI